jgi:hypothetical protein
VFSHTVVLPYELLRIGTITALYLASIWGWGSLVCGWLSPSQERLPDFIAARVVTGCLCLYAGFIALAWLHELHPVPVFAILAAGLLLAVLHLRGLAGRLRTKCVEISRWPLVDRFLLALVSLLALLQLACAFTPLTFYDTQVYQLLAPAEFLRAGYLVHIPWNVLTNSPQAVQLTLGMSWVADPTGNTFKLLMASLGFMILLAAARIGLELGIRAGLLSALFVAAYPEFWIHQTLGVVDLSIAAFLIFGAVWCLEAFRLQDWSRAILAGIAFGFVVGSRYQGILLVGWIVLAAMVWERVDVRRAAAVGAIASALTLPWLIRNFAAFGNPVYPLMHGLLGGAEWSAAQAAVLQSVVTGPGLSALHPAQMLIAPFRALLMFPANGLFGIPVLLAGIVAAFSNRVKGLRVYAVIGIGGLIAWGLLHPTRGVELLRYNAASLILLLACTGALLAGRALYPAVALAVISAVIGIASLSGIFPVWRSLANAEVRMEVVQANVPSWQALDFANARLDPVRDKVLLIGETRGLWLKAPFVAPSAYNGRQLVELFDQRSGPPVWTQRLHVLGITHILICSSEWQRLADTVDYFRLPDDHLHLFLNWLHTLPVMFDDHHGNALLAV